MVDVRKSKPIDYIRFVFSALLLLFSTVVTFYAIIEKKTQFWRSVPGWAALILFIIDLFMLGIVEGLQIALVELKRQHPDSYRKTHPRAYALGQTAFSGDNVERFLMGRQVFVVFLVFFAAKLTTIYVNISKDETFLFPVPGWVSNVFLETGILACIIVVIVAQLMPQIVAAKYPVHFLQFIIMKPAYYLCIVVEASGLTHITWVLSFIMQLCFRMKDDKTTVNPTALNLYNSSDSSDNESGTGTLECEDSNAKPDHENGEAEVLMRNELGEDTEELSVRSKTTLPTENQQNMPTIVKLKQDGYRVASMMELIDNLQSEVNADTLTAYRHYLDSHPEKFWKFPSVIGNKVYASPGEIANNLRSHDCDVPRFLLDISDPHHVPPHIVACELSSRLLEQQREMDELRARVAKLESNM